MLPEQEINVFDCIIYAMLQLQIPTSVYPWEVCKVPKIEMS